MPDRQLDVLPPDIEAQIAQGCPTCQGRGLAWGLPDPNQMTGEILLPCRECARVRAIVVPLVAELETYRLDQALDRERMVVRESPAQNYPRAVAEAEQRGYQRALADVVAAREEKP